MVLLSKSAVLLMLLLTVQCQDLNNEVRTGEAGEDKRRDQLRWFPADSETDCQVEPGPEQVETDLSLMSCTSCAGEGGEAHRLVLSHILNNYHIATVGSTRSDSLHHLVLLTRSAHNSIRN